MRFVEKIMKIKAVKIGLLAVCVFGVLAAAFFFQKTPVKNTPIKKNELTTSSTSLDETKSGILTSEAIISPSEVSTSQTEATNGEKTNPTDTKETVTSTTATTKATKDKYETDPVPEGKPKPVEPENVTTNKNKTYTATLSIRCDTILNNMNIFNKDKLSVLPSDGTILNTTTVTFFENESVFDVLKRVTREKRIHMEFVFTPIFNSAYIEGIHNLYEFDCGELSGWMYKVNGWFPNYGVSRYVLKQGDVIEFVYTCDLGKDVGDNSMSSKNQMGN